jgi:hypothetical protein
VEYTNELFSLEVRIMDEVIIINDSTMSQSDVEENIRIGLG